MNYINTFFSYMINFLIICLSFILLTFILYIFIKSKVNKISIFQTLKNILLSIRLNVFVKGSIKKDLEDINFNRLKFLVKNNKIVFYYQVLSIKDIRKMEEKEIYLYKYIVIQLPKYNFTSFYDENGVRKMVGTKIK